MSEKRAKERLTDLFNEADTPHGGPYLTRPLQQFRTIDSRYNELIYDLAPAAQSALKDAGVWREYVGAPGGPWLHAHMVACITASIELATLERDDVSYIAGWRVLKRAKTELRYPVSFVDPASKRRIKKDLIPDALFGLEYHTVEGSRFRFFVVEADRATEPLTASTWNRKSVVRSIRQYQAYIGDSGYRRQLQLTAPLIVLNVCSDAARAEKMMATLQRLEPGGVAYQLFQSWDGFGDVWRPQPPNGDLLTRPWQRAGCPTFKVDQV